MRKLHIDIGRLAQGFILLNFSIYLFQLLKTGEINRLVAPYLSLLVGVTFLVIVILMLYAFSTSFIRKQKEDFCSCCAHKHSSKPKKSWLLLILPSVIGVCFPIHSLNASMLHNAPSIHPITNTSIATRFRETKNPEKKQTIQERTSEKKKEGNSAKIKELSLADIQDDFISQSDSYINKSFKLLGMVYHPPGWPMNRMIVMRYMITCCAADATPVGVAVEMKEAAKYKDNTWVTITGLMNEKRIEGADSILPLSWAQDMKNKPVLLGRSIKSSVEPKNPYILVPLINLTPGGK
jgi:putative membrane protein